MQVIGVCRFSFPAVGGFQVEHDSIEEREAYLYASERMEERFETFESFTLPALRAQTDQNFTFLVVTGRNMPDVYRARLYDHLIDMPQAVVLSPEPARHRSVMAKQINKVREDTGLPSLQFRMDDDDAVAVTYVERLREAAQDLRGLIRKSRYTGIDFNQGWIADTGPKGIYARPCVKTLWTPALAIAVKAGASRSVMNFSHAKLARIMPVTSFTGEDMFIRGYNRFNDSRQKDGIVPVRLRPVDAETEAHFRTTFNIDADHIRARYSAPK